MKRKQFTDEQIIPVAKESEAGAKTLDVCRKHGVTEHTLAMAKQVWRDAISEAKRLKELEAENRRLKQLLAKAHLDNAALKEGLSRNW
jgi:putative transposase